MPPLRITALLVSVSSAYAAPAVDLAAPPAASPVAEPAPAAPLVLAEEPAPAPARLVLHAAAPVLDYTANLTYEYTENIGRASGRADYHDASVVRAGFAAGAGRQLAGGVTGRVQLEGAGLASWDYDKLSEITLGPRASARKKFGLGPTAPTLSGEVSALGKLARLDEQNGVTFQSSVTAAKRFNSLVTAQVRAEWQQHVAAHDIFEERHVGVEASIAFDITRNLRFSVGGGYVDGVFAAGASKARLDSAKAGALGGRIAEYYNTVPDKVTNTFETGWTVYRVRGDADYFFVDFSPALGDSLSLAFRYERIHTVNIVDVGYEQDVYSAGLIYRF